MWIWGQEEDWEQLPRESAGTPVKGAELGCAAAWRGRWRLAGTGLSREPRRTATWFPPPCCMGLEGREKARWWLITALVPDRAGVEEWRRARDLELFGRTEFEMILGGTCRMKKTVDHLYADKKQVNKNWGEVEGQADGGQQGPRQRAWPWSWSDS